VQTSKRRRRWPAESSRDRAQEFLQARVMVRSGIMSRSGELARGFDCQTADAPFFQLTCVGALAAGFARALRRRPLEPRGRREGRVPAAPAVRWT